MSRCALITGCSAGGIGSALVEELHTQGVRVYATARSQSKMSHLDNLPNVVFVTLDVVDPVSIAAAVDTVRQDLSSRGDSLSILINNAGQSIVSPALDTSIENAKRLFDVNLWGAMAVTQAFTPLLQTAENGSTIVNVCSIACFLNPPYMSIYNASKAALLSWSETIRLELQPFNIRVISLVSGAVATNLISHTDLALPEKSLYQKALSEIQKRGVGDDIPNKTAREDFAREVVKDILGGAAGPLWRGAMASIANFVAKFVPTFILDRGLKIGTGLDRLP